MIPEDRLDQIANRFGYLEARMAETADGGEIARLSREYAELKPVVAVIETWRATKAQIAEAEALLADPDMAELAAEEKAALEARLPDLAESLRRALVPKDAADARSAMIEIRPGTGGEEAALFAADLMRMYQRHAERHGWGFDVVEAQESELGGLREGVVRVSGDGVFARLKF